MQEILEKKQTFIRYISHEIRSPLNVANLGLNIIKESLQQEIIDRNDLTNLIIEIENSGTVSIDLVNDLLTYEKIESGNIVLKKELTNAYELFSEALRPFIIQVNN